MALRFSEKGELICILCGAVLEGEEEVNFERMCTDCINKIPASERVGWRKFVERQILPRLR